MPTATAGNVAGMICNWAAVTAMVMPSDAFLEGDSLSLTVAVKFELPLAVGAPEMIPADERVSPVGRLPDVTDQLYVATPPVACRVWV